jgi:hydroxyacylglutathione hydrolase
VLHTPGHTPTHLSYVVTDGHHTSVFTGGSLLYGSVGRTDLISRAMADELTRRQFASVRRLAAELADDATVLPTHGFGSFCSSAAADAQTADVDPRYGVATSTIGVQRRENIALTIVDEQTFVDTILGGLDAYPRYYAHMAPRNRLGPEPIDLSPPIPADASELAARIHAGEWVVDLRSRTAYASDHVIGTVNIEVTDSLVTYLAWLIPWGTPLTLIGDTAAEVAEAQRQLTRVGIDRPAAAATGGIAHWGDQFSRAARSGSVTTRELAAQRRARPSEAPFVLDVRRHDERRNRAIAGSAHIPLHELTRRAAEVPADRDVWVHCAGGYRASIAASLLVRAGRRPVLIDDDEQAITTLGLDRSPECVGSAGRGLRLQADPALRPVGADLALEHRHARLDPSSASRQAANASSRWAAVTAMRMCAIADLELTQGVQQRESADRRMRRADLAGDADEFRLGHRLVGRVVEADHVIHVVGVVTDAAEERHDRADVRCADPREHPSTSIGPRTRPVTVADVVLLPTRPHPRRPAGAARPRAPRPARSTRVRARGPRTPRRAA